jgi:hypothetical protein
MEEDSNQTLGPYTVARLTTRLLALVPNRTLLSLPLLDINQDETLPPTFSPDQDRWLT